jgi:hypothetical protein
MPSIQQHHHQDQHQEQQRRTTEEVAQLVYLARYRYGNDLDEGSRD